MWVQVDGLEVREGDGPLRLAPPGALMDEGVYAVTRNVLPARDMDGVVPIPGRDPLAGGQACYWLTGTVGDDVRDLNEGHRFQPAAYRFLVTAGEMQVVGRYDAKRRHGAVEPGRRVTLECSFLLGGGWDWDWDDLPDEWSSQWRVLLVIERYDDDRPDPDYVIQVEAVPAPGSDAADQLDLRPPDGDPVRSFLSQVGQSSRYRLIGTQPLPLLLQAGDGSGPLWYRSVDGGAPVAMSLDRFELSGSLRERLERWSGGAGPRDEASWHQEGLALLAALREELSPAFDITFCDDPHA